MNNRLKLLRHTHELTQTDAAALLGITQQQYSLLERGRRELRAGQIRALCAHYRVSADYLLGMTL